MDCKQNSTGKVISLSDPLPISDKPRYKNSRLSHEYVESRITACGYQLKGQYKNSRQKMDLICPSGHEWSAQWDAFNKGRRCWRCANRMPDQKDVEKAFANEGYQLKSQYQNCEKDLKFVCPNGHESKTTWSRFSIGRRCRYCAGQVVKHEDVEKAFAQEGYKLLSKYTNSKTKLEFVCPNYHRHAMLWSAFYSGTRCAYCAGKIVTHEDVEKAFTEEGYQLLSKYEKSDKKLEFICPEGHRHRITWGDFKAGYRCAYCAGKIVTHEEVEKAFTKEGYQLLSKYEKSDKKLEFICPEGHRHSIVWDSFRDGSRCAHCAEYGYNPNKPGRLYYVRFDTSFGPLWKLGITNRTIQQRFKPDKIPYVILLDEWHKDGKIPQEKERQIKRQHKKHKYKGDYLLKIGNTECFTKDVLKLDKQIVQLPLPLSIAI